MRAIGLALVALALSASPASAAVLEIRDNFCGCDGSSGDEDTRTLIVRAAPGEVNRMSVRQMPQGVLVEDAGGPLTGACRVSSSGGRFCRGAFDGAEVELGDGDDTLGVETLGSAVDAGAGADTVLVTGSFHVLRGGAGADRLEAGSAATAMVSYSDHTEGVTVRLNGLADDGAAGEGDQVLGAISSIQGGAGDDTLEAGPETASLTGEGGDDTLLAGLRGTVLQGGGGDDELLGGDGDDTLLGGDGADVHAGGNGRDAATYYDHDLALRVTIGDGANDGEALEGDDIRPDVEDVAGGPRADVIIGDGGPNRLAGGGGADEIYGLGGDDQLRGTIQGALLDPGPGRDLLAASAGDRLRLDDGEADHVRCPRNAPAVSADGLDTFDDCAPAVWVRDVRSSPPGRLRVRIRCDGRSAVPCRGSLVLRWGRRAYSRAMRFGPLRPAERRVVSIRLLRPLTRHCVRARVTTRRDDIPASTELRFAVHCRLP